VTGIASEHDDAAGTRRGPNTIFVFELDDTRVCHFGDFGQSTLRDEQADAIGGIDLLFIPVGGGPTIGGEAGAAITRRLAPRWVVPMHYRTERVDFLEPPDSFLDQLDEVQRLETPSFDTADLPSRDRATVAVVPGAP
jgi:L-ascorbate metabolism protein UlaG (beta-lactamase superfamily)